MEVIKIPLEHVDCCLFSRPGGERRRLPGWRDCPASQTGAVGRERDETIKDRTDVTRGAVEDECGRTDKTLRRVKMIRDTWMDTEAGAATEERAWRL